MSDGTCTPAHVQTDHQTEQKNPLSLCKQIMIMIEILTIEN